MQKFSRFLILAGLAVSTLCAQGARGASAPAPKKQPAASSQPRNLGTLDVVVDTQTIPVRITGIPAELQTLAQIAFNAHGRYDVTGRRPPLFDIRFTGATANQVRVDITRGTTAVASQTVVGTTTRNALLRAADVAVEKTNGLGLRGFFAARLAFVSKRTGRSEIYASDLFAGEAKQLTSNGAHVLTPRWSPDATKLIFTSYHRGGSPDIYVINPITGRQDTFLSLRGTNTGARFSPNGQQVAMVLTGSGVAEIYTGTAQGTQISQKTRSDIVKSSPCWSPDGSQILFAMGEPGPQLYVMPAAGGTPRRLPVGFTYVAEPDWSSASRNKIACTVRVGRQYQIAVFDLAAGKAQVVSKASFDGVEPSWLGDGRHVVYTARDRTTSVLCILDTDTGRSTPITPRDAAALHGSVWSQ